MTREILVSQISLATCRIKVYNELPTHRRDGFSSSQMSAPHGTLQDIITLGRDLLAMKWYFTGSCALLAYDYCLTFDREVDEIWWGRKTPIFYLYLSNRYCPMAFCVVTLFAYFSSLWTFEICNRFAIVEWIQTLLVVIPAETILVYRSYALSNRNKFIIGFLIAIMTSQCVAVVYAMSRPGTNGALQIPIYNVDPFHVCILFSDPRMDTAYLSLTIIFDIIVFSVTLHRTAIDAFISQNSALLRTIRWDGTIYFCVILAGNIVWLFLALFARPGLKFMNSQPSMILTSIMITRLTLSLRHASQHGGRVFEISCDEGNSGLQLGCIHDDDPGKEPESIVMTSMESPKSTDALVVK